MGKPVRPSGVEDEEVLRGLVDQLFRRHRLVSVECGRIGNPDCQAQGSGVVHVRRRNRNERHGIPLHDGVVQHTAVPQGLHDALEGLGATLVRVPTAEHELRGRRKICVPLPQEQGKSQLVLPGHLIDLQQREVESPGRRWTDASKDGFQARNGALVSAGQACRPRRSSGRADALMAVGA
eukprot:scaffold183_cov249-Pinguiococcus_pyrenoidosus.AAC.4